MQLTIAISQTRFSSRMEPLHNGPGTSGRAYLETTFRDAWIGRGVITPLNVFFWGYVKNRVYKTAVNDKDHLKEKIQESVRFVTADMIAATWV